MTPKLYTMTSSQILNEEESRVLHKKSATQVGDSSQTQSALQSDDAITKLLDLSGKVSFTGKDADVPVTSCLTKKPDRSTTCSGVAPRKPKRCLTAYNFFFKDTRQSILAARPKAEITTKAKSQRNRQRNRRPTHGKITFAALGKEIAEKWKITSPEERRYYQELANKDKERYIKEMAVWKKYEAMRKKQVKRQDKEKAKKATSDQSTRRKDVVNQNDTNTSHPQRRVTDIQPVGNRQRIGMEFSARESLQVDEESMKFPYHQQPSYKKSVKAEEVNEYKNSLSEKKESTQRTFPVRFPVQINMEPAIADTLPLNTRCIPQPMKRSVFSESSFAEEKLSANIGNVSTVTSCALARAISDRQDNVERWSSKGGASSPLTLISESNTSLNHLSTHLADSSVMSQLLTTNQLRSEMFQQLPISRGAGLQRYQGGQLFITPNALPDQAMDNIDIDDIFSDDEGDYGVDSGNC